MLLGVKLAAGLVWLPGALCHLCMSLLWQVGESGQDASVTSLVVSGRLPPST